MPQGTFYRRLGKHKQRDRIKELADGRLALADYSPFEEEIRKMLRQHGTFYLGHPYIVYDTFSRQDTADPETMASDIAPWTGRRPEDSEFRTVFFKVYGQELTELKEKTVLYRKTRPELFQ